MPDLKRLNNRDNIIVLISAFVLVLFEIWSLNCFRINYDYIIDSDMSSELILSKLMAHEGTILTDKWYYSTELRVLSIDLVYAPLFHIFGSWHRIRLAGAVILNLLITLGTFLVFKTTDHKRWFLFASLGILLPLSEDCCKFVLLNSCYVPYIVISLFGIYLSFAFAKTKGKEKIIFIVLAAVLALLSGLSGGRQLLVFYLPLAVTGSVILAYDYLTEKKIDITWLSFKFFLISIVSVFFSAIGVKINTGYLSKIYSFDNWEHIDIAEFNLSDFIMTINGMLNTLGYRAGPMDLYTIVSDGVAVILFVLAIVSVVFGIANKDKVSPFYFIMSVLVASSTVVFVMFYSFTTMVYVTRYGIPVVITFFINIAMFFAHVEKNKMAGRICFISAYVILVASMVLSSVLTVNVYKDAYASRDKADVDQFRLMAEEGYTSGYASFWQANVVTELTDGKIDMRTFAVFVSPAEMYYMTSINQTYTWLQLTEHETTRPLNGKVCIILTPEEYDNCIWKGAMSNYQIYSSDNYDIFGFNSYYDMLGVIGSYQYKLDGEFLTNGYDENGVRTLNPGGFSFGPYITLYEGTYRVTVRGENLDNASVDCTSFHGSNHFPYTVVSSSDDELIVEFTADCDHYEGEVAIYNTSDSEEMILTYLSLDYVTR